MVFSYNLISEIVDLEGLTVEEVRDRLTFSGFEVEEMSPFASASKLVIGQIISCEKHPDSDHLHLLKVDCGSEGILDIVCGAPNARKGIKVIVALPGCELPALGTTIKAGSIRGYASNGMCCSLKELGVDENCLTDYQKNGIEELPEDAPVGEHEVLKYLGIDDWLFDINVLPNRPDCLSYMGIAREIGSLFGRMVKEIPHHDVPEDKGLSVSSTTEACNRFDLLSVENVKPKTDIFSKIKHYLYCSGVRPVSPIVDLGNFSMLLSGQPVNMYDAGKNTNRNYVARSDIEGDYKTFDGKTISVIPGDIVITDGERPLCLGGIMALEDAEIRDDTSDVDIEFASFYHANIRHTSNRLGLASFSENLFAKTRNPYMIDEALDIIIELLPYFLDSYDIVGRVSYNSLENNETRIPFSLEKLNKKLGAVYTKEQCDKVFDAYRIQKEGDSLIPPIDRPDLKEQCDFEEEVFRYYGADILKPSLTGFPMTYGSLTKESKDETRIKNYLVYQGFSEILTYTLISEQQDAFRAFIDSPSYKVVNPMTKDHEYVRSDLLASMLSVIDYNLSYRNDDLELFETSSISSPSGERNFLSLALVGNLYDRDGVVLRPYSFADIKGYVENILGLVGISGQRIRLNPSGNALFHEYLSVDLYVGKDHIATFGKISPKVRTSNIFLGEIDLGKLLSLKGSKIKCTSYAVNPLVRRDLSFLIGGNVSYDDVKRCIQKVPNVPIADVSLFDIFSDPLGRTYYGISVYLKQEDKTLTDAEINAAMDAVKKACKDKLNLSLRGE